MRRDSIGQTTLLMACLTSRRDAQPPEMTSPLMTTKSGFSWSSTFSISSTVRRSVSSSSCVSLNCTTLKVPSGRNRSSRAFGPARPDGAAGGVVPALAATAARASLTAPSAPAVRTVRRLSGSRSDIHGLLRLGRCIAAETVGAGDGRRPTGR